MQEERGFTGIWVPAHIVLDENLSVNEKIVYAYVASFTKCCWQSNEQIAAKLNMSERTVSRTLQELQKKQHVFVEFVKNNSANRRIFVIVDNPKKIKYLSKKGAFGEVRQNVQPSDEVRQIGEGVRQNVQPTNREEVRQIVYHRINKNKERIKQDDVSPARETADEPSCDLSEEFDNFKQSDLWKRLKRASAQTKAGAL